jgi:hypothetical protein
MLRPTTRSRQAQNDTSNLKESKKGKFLFQSPYLTSSNPVVGQKRVHFDQAIHIYGAKCMRNSEEGDSDYHLPTDIETQKDSEDFVSKQNNKRQKTKDKRDSKKQSTIGNWIYDFGSNLINKAFGQDEGPCSQTSDASRGSKKRRSCKKKQTAPLIDKNYSGENRLTLMPMLPPDQKLVQKSKKVE